MTKTTTESKRRRLKGIVVSDKMSKAVVVRVDRTVMHAKYHKRYTVSQRYKARELSGEVKTGMNVTIEETRPLSADIRWRVVEVVK